MGPRSPSAYYWHRFYSHQPDLNFDNPARPGGALPGVSTSGSTWASTACGSTRCRTCTSARAPTARTCPRRTPSCASCARTSTTSYPNRMLLAEANQWPEDAAAYFGNGDECHMNFHFPLMPRMFMAIRMEDRFPIVDILRQTPPIPDNCQWALFLRNHDELTLEMVTDEERDYMYRAYAAGPRGAHQPRHPPPPGAAARQRPQAHRADERAACSRCPARRSSITATRSAWATTSTSATATACARRCSGAATATPASRAPTRSAVPAGHHRPRVPLRGDQRRGAAEQPALAAVVDEAAHRAAQAAPRLRPRQRSSSCTPRTARCWRSSAATRPSTILCVANLSRFAAGRRARPGAVRRACVPVELFGRTELPPIGDTPYFLTLGPHAFYWFSLQPKPSQQLLSDWGLTATTLPEVQRAGGRGSQCWSTAARRCSRASSSATSGSAGGSRGKARRLQVHPDHRLDRHPHRRGHGLPDDHRRVVTPRATPRRTFCRWHMPTPPSLRRSSSAGRTPRSRG